MYATVLVEKLLNEKTVSEVQFVQVTVLIYAYARKAPKITRNAPIQAQELLN